MVRVEQICRPKCRSIRHKIDLSIYIRYVTDLTDLIQDVVVASANNENSHTSERERGHTVYTTAEWSVLWDSLSSPLARILC